MYAICANVVMPSFFLFLSSLFCMCSNNLQMHIMFDNVTLHSQRNAMSIVRMCTKTNFSCSSRTEAGLVPQLQPHVCVCVRQVWLAPLGRFKTIHFQNKWLWIKFNYTHCRVESLSVCCAAAPSFVYDRVPSSNVAILSCRCRATVVHRRRNAIVTHLPSFNRVSVCCMCCMCGCAH